MYPLYHDLSHQGNINGLSEVGTVFSASAELDHAPWRLSPGVCIDSWTCWYAGCMDSDEKTLGDSYPDCGRVGSLRDPVPHDARCTPAQPRANGALGGRAEVDGSGHCQDGA